MIFNFSVLKIALASAGILQIVHADDTAGESKIKFSYLSATDLVEKYLQDPNGLVEFRNIESSKHTCFALFANGHAVGQNQNTGAYLIPDSGIILSSGNPEDFNGQDSDSTTTDFHIVTGDEDLENTIPGANVFDPCYIQFEFRCPPSSDIFTPEVNFDYVFGSEEYIEYVFSRYNDVFGFFLNGENIALVPGSDTPVSINNVNAEVNSQYYVDNVLAGRGNRTSPYPLIEADGFTTKMTAIAEPEPEWNLIKMVTGDVSDGILDSWVLLAAGTFSCVRRTEMPSLSPSPTPKPSISPTIDPTNSPSIDPTTSPSSSPTEKVTTSPSSSPTLSPTSPPSNVPTEPPSSNPTLTPSLRPTSSPTNFPTHRPSRRPTSTPSMSPTNRPTDFPTADPTSHPTVITSTPSVSLAPTYPYPCGLLPCDRTKALKEFYSTISDPALFDNPSTPQSLALDWIIHHDSMKVCPNDKSCHAIQRYVMAVLYFSLHGYQWKECSAPKDYECEEDINLANANCNILAFPHYPNQTRVGCLYTMAWLTPYHECMWGGLSCHGEDEPEIAWCMDQIELEANNVKGYIPVEISSLEHLRFLALEQGNTTGVIPASLGSLENIEIIDLDYNKLTGSIPETIYELPNLRQLDLDNNALTGTLSGSIGNLSHLQILQLDHNFMTGTIPSEMSNLEELEVAFLSYNNFIGKVDEGICDLRAPFGNLTKLQVDCAIDGGKVECNCCSSCRQPVEPV